MPLTSGQRLQPQKQTKIARLTLFESKGNVIYTESSLLTASTHAAAIDPCIVSTVINYSAHKDTALR